MRWASRLGHLKPRMRRVGATTYTAISVILAVYALVTGDLLRWAIVVLGVLSAALFYELIRRPNPDSGSGPSELRLRLAALLDSGNGLAYRLERSDEHGDNLASFDALVGEANQWWAEVESVASAGRPDLLPVLRSEARMSGSAWDGHGDRYAAVRNRVDCRLRQLESVLTEV